MRKTIDNNFDSYQQNIVDDLFEGGQYSDDGFDILEPAPIKKNNDINGDELNKLKLVSKGKLNETKMIPLILYTDSFTAEQTVVLLDMIRFCMEKSAEGKSDDVKEFTINLHIKNRSNSDFVISIGDDSQDAIAYEKDVFIGH